MSIRRLAFPSGNSLPFHGRLRFVLFCSSVVLDPRVGHTNGRNFSIYLCPVILINSSMGNPVHVLMLSIQTMRGLLACVHLVLFIALSLSPYFILQHDIKQIRIITVEYKNMPEGCQRSKRSLNWPPILLYNWLVQIIQATREKKQKGYKGVTCRTTQTS